MPRPNPQPSDLQELLELAQVAQALQGPQQDQAQLAERERQSRLGAAIQLFGLTQSGASDAAQLEELRRYHEGTLVQGQADIAQKDRERAAILAAQEKRDTANTLDNLVAHLAGRSDVDLDTLAGTLAKAGHHELADAVGEQAQRKQHAKVLTHLTAVTALRQANKDTLPYLNSIKQSDPATWEALQPYIPHGAGGTWGKPTKNPLDLNNLLSAWSMSGGG